MKLFFTVLFCIGFVQNMDTNPTRRMVSDDDFNYTFYVSDKHIDDHKDAKEYYWFKKGSVHFSVGGSDGHILHGDYKKTYRTHGLAEQGEFNFGLKVKSWKSWYQNGQVDEIVHWSDGLKYGKYQKFNTSGKLIRTGKYKSSKKHGKWIDHSIQDTLYFKRGKKVLKEALEEESEGENEETKGFFNKTKKFFRNIFKKKGIAKGESTKEKSVAKKSFLTSTKEFFRNLFKKKTEVEKQQIKKAKAAKQKQKQKELEAKRKEFAAKEAAKKTTSTHKTAVSKQ